MASRPEERDSSPMSNVTEEEADSAISSFIETSHRIPAALSSTRLAQPIVIPQRRPGNKQRGFMQAYAPILSDFEISQEYFHDFIDSLNKAIQVSKWLAAVQIAAFGAGFVPNQISMGVTTAVQVVSAVAAKAEIRWKVNSFLDKVNKEVFCPRGLYCLIVTYNPIALQNQTDFLDKSEGNSATIQQSEPSRSSAHRVKRNLRNPWSATTQGEKNLPSEVAPLVFSDRREESLYAQTKSKPWNKVNDYFDKRAQAKYAVESNHDSLSLPSVPEFKHRYLDPNHPATNGGLLGLLSGGHLTQDPRKLMEDTKNVLQQQESLIKEQQEGQLELLRMQFQAMGYSQDQMRETMSIYENQFQLQRDQLQTQIEGTTQLPRKIVRNVLYLMIVNLPNKEEIAAVKENENIVQGDSVTMVNVE